MVGTIGNGANTGVKKKRNGQRTVIKGTRADPQKVAIKATAQARPVTTRKYDPKIWEKYKTAQGFTKWRKKQKPQRLIPRHETKKKGTISGKYGAQ
jgi:uncharacterized GH25 family protein